jgi:MoxR-like ATPase
MSTLKELKPGYVFDTVFWIEKQADGSARVAGRNVNGGPAPLPVVTEDRRVLPGRRCKVRVEQVRDEDILVSYLGLVDFKLEDDIYIEPDLLRHFEILLCSGRSILLEGPQGTGKTTIAAALARTLGMEYVFFNCSICFEPSDFVGSLHLLVDEDKNPRTEWLPTEVLRAVVEANENPARRYLIFLDELNRTRSYALNGIMSAIDSTRRIFDPRINSYIPIPDNVQWIAAVNRGKSFTGTYQLDMAQLDRFAVLKMDYPPEKEEVRILARRYDMVPARHVRKVVAVAQALRAEPTIMTDLSMRATDEACLFLSYPIYQKKVAREDMLRILKTSFCNRLAGNVTEEGSEAHVAFGVIERMVLLDKLEGEADA